MRFLNALTRTKSFLLAAILGLAAGPMLTLAKGKPGGETQTQKFSVSQPDVNGDGVVDASDHGLLIVGAWPLDADGNRYLSDDISLLCGRASSSDVVINNPPPAVLLPMLADFVDEDGDAWIDTNTDPYRISGGTLVFNAASGNSGPTATYFFGAFNKNGDHQMHRLDADAVIMGPHAEVPAEGFPLGAAIGETYTVFLSNWYLSHDTGSAKLAYEGPVDGGATIIVVERFQ